MIIHVHFFYTRWVLPRAVYKKSRLFYCFNAEQQLCHTYLLRGTEREFVQVPNSSEKTSANCVSISFVPVSTTPGCCWWIGSDGCCWWLAARTWAHRELMGTSQSPNISNYSILIKSKSAMSEIKHLHVFFCTPLSMKVHWSLPNKSIVGWRSLHTVEPCVEDRDFRIWRICCVEIIKKHVIN